MKTPQYYVIMAGGETPWVLDIRPKTEADCQRAIRWQHTGNNNEPMFICTYDKDAGEFVSDSRRFKLGRGPYTVEAWNAAVARNFEQD